MYKFLYLCLVSLTTVEEKTINPSNKVPTNVTVVVANVSDASTTPNISEPIHPENHSGKILKNERTLILIVHFNDF